MYTKSDFGRMRAMLPNLPLDTAVRNGVLTNAGKSVLLNRLPEHPAECGDFEPHSHYKSMCKKCHWSPPGSLCDDEHCGVEGRDMWDHALLFFAEKVSTLSVITELADIIDEALSVEELLDQAVSDIFRSPFRAPPPFYN